MKTKLFITGLVFFAMTSVGFSQNIRNSERQGRNQGNCPAWVDENKNGICDNYENRTPGQGRGNGNGFCCGRNQGQPGKGMMNGQGRGRYFVDENKNGVCDRFEDMKKAETIKKQ
jgi:hypothetical protein